MTDTQSTYTPPASHDLGVPRWHIASLDAYRALHRRSIDDPEGFWGEAARELHWFTPFSRVVEFTPPDARWFLGGTTNLCYNCVDRHVEQGHGGEVGIVWEGEPMLAGGPEVRHLTYAELREQTSRFANVLRSLGVTSGDVVTIYMGMVPELAVAVLACARIGAAHSVIFGGFSANAIADRMADASSRVIVTCDGAWRRGAVVPLKANVDEAMGMLERQGHRVDSCIVVRRCGNPIAMSARDRWWHDEMSRARPDGPCEPLDSEHTAFLLYTSGSTGKPKGILHTVGGYMVHTALSAKYVFNLIPGLSAPVRSGGHTGQLFWCTADVGWITGHSYILYGVMSNRVPTLMFEGAPNHPGPDRFWDIIARHRVTQFYTAPTAIRAFMKWGEQHPARHDLSSLQVLGSVGEPINPAAWAWYREHIGGGRCPIVDTYWQTETGGHMITPLPGATPTKPGSCTLPFLGIDAAVVDAQGNDKPAGQDGLLVIRKPWPGMLRGVYNDRQRFIDTYWSTVKGCYTAGDGAKRDQDGYFWITGRIDDVINVSGHRLGTMEVESALVGHESVVEAAVVGMPHEIKGQGIAAFVTLALGHEPDDRVREALRGHVAREIGPFAKPDMIRFTDALPKTRSGKIMRRLLRAIAAGETQVSQDTTTLEDFSVLAKLSQQEED
jgi:acetyl-CoA synthetase